MADLGAIGYDISTSLQRDQAITPSLTWAGGDHPKDAYAATLVANGLGVVITGKPDPHDRTMVSPPVNYTISGNVTAAAVPVSGCLVRAFRRDTGEYLARAYTDGSGNYTLTIIGYNGSEGVTVVAYDPAGGTNYNAVILDQMTPG